MIKKFESYSEDMNNKEAIDSVAYVENKLPNGDVYQHELVFVIPYHENTILSTKDYTSRGSAYDIKKHEFKFDEFEKSLNLLKRDIKHSRFVYDEKVSEPNDDFGTYCGKSKREGKPIYLLRYVTTKNGQKRYSENALELLRKKYPELRYDKEV